MKKTNGMAMNILQNFLMTDGNKHVSCDFGNFKFQLTPAIQNMLDEFSICL